MAQWKNPTVLPLAVLLFAPAICGAEDAKGPEERELVVAKPGDRPKYRRLIEKMLMASPKGHRVMLTVVSVLDTNYGDRHLERLKSAVPIDAKGRKDGIEEQFRTTHYGHLERAVPYKAGVREGIEKVWGDRDDQGGRYVRSEVPWKNDKRLGTLKCFHPNGKLSSETEYLGDLAHGKTRSLSIDGKLLREGEMRDGKRHGIVTEYWTKTDTPKRVIPYNAGKVTGVVKECYSNGKLKREITFKDDAMHGVEKQYEVDGKLSRTRYWFDGDIVSKDEFKTRN